MTTPIEIQEAYNNPNWAGWGYLGERQVAFGRLPSETINEIDRGILAATANAGLSSRALFEWLNSRPGRHFGDWAFGGGLDLSGDIQDQVIKYLRPKSFDWIYEELGDI